MGVGGKNKLKIQQGRVTEKKLCKPEVKKKIPTEWIALLGLQTDPPDWMEPCQPL